MRLWGLFSKIFSYLWIEQKELRREGRGKLLVSIAVGWGMLVGTRMIYPILLPYLRNSFDFTLTIAGLLVTVLWLSAAVGQLPGGILADKFSERKLMTASIILAAMAVIIVVAASTAKILYAGTVLFGLSFSLYPVARITILSDIYPDRIGSALGVTMATGDLGQTLLPPIAGIIAAAIAWQAGLAFTIPLLFCICIFIWVTIPNQDEKASAVNELSVDEIQYIVTELRRPVMILITVILVFYILVWQAFSGFYPIYLTEIKGLSTSSAGLLFGLFFASGIVIKPTAGFAYDRIGMRGSLLIVLVGPLIGLLLLPFIDQIWLLAVITILVSTILGLGAIIQSYLADTFSEDMHDTGLGVIRTIAATLGASGPVIFGVIADQGYFNEGYVILALIVAVVIFLTLFLPTATNK